MQIYTASHQWATRPSDERFQTLQEVIEKTRGYRAASRTATVPWSDVRVEAQGDDLSLVGKAGVPARIGNWAFGQLSARASAPANYLRSLPTTLAAQNLNYGLKARDGREDAILLFHRIEDDSLAGKHLVLRAATSDIYERIWNYEIAERVADLADQFKMVPAHATFEGMDTHDKALYASDHDLFLFLMSTDRVLTDNKSALRRGFFVWNSEVGATSLGVSRFLFRDVCQNHIIWGAEGLQEIRIAHRGKIARNKWGEVRAEFRQYLNSSASTEENAIYAAQQVILGDTKEDVLDKLFGRRAIAAVLPRRTLEAAYDAVVPEQDGPANTAWGFVQGLTRHSQTLPYADERTALDRAGRKILEVAF